MSRAAKESDPAEQVDITRMLTSTEALTSSVQRSRPAVFLSTASKRSVIRL